MINSFKNPSTTIQEIIPIPKKHLIDQYFWFVNAGILSSSIYEKAVLFVGTHKFTSTEFIFVVFLGIKYLIHFIELFTFDNTPLLMETISKHLRYLQSLLGTQRKSKRVLNYKFITNLQFIFNNLQLAKCTNYICRQLYIDQLERFCHLFASRLDIWIKNDGLQAYLYRYGYDPYRSSVIYNSFLIPNQRKYIDPLCRVDQKFIEKIEVKCNCKIILSVENVDCYLFPENITLEVVFDLYRGNYLGFMEMFGYIVKQLNPSLYFAKSLRTILIEGSVFYNILTNVPYKKLTYLEKTVIAGCPVEPFLGPYTISKRLISIVAQIKEQDPNGEGFQPEEISQSDISEELSKVTELNLVTRKYYDQNLSVSEINKLQDDLHTINYSQNLLMYFQWRYDKEINEINMNKIKEKEIARNQNDESKKDKIILMPKAWSASETTYLSNTDFVLNPIHEETTNVKEFNSTIMNENSSACVEKHYSVETSSMKTNENVILSYKNISKIGQQSGKDIGYHINENNFRSVDLSNIDNTNPISISPLEQFRLLLREPFHTYADDHNAVNHQLRLMLRCDTEEVIQDIKNPYSFRRKTIKDRLVVKKPLSFKIEKPVSRFRSNISVADIKSNIMINIMKKSWLSKTASKLLSSGVKSVESEEKKSNSSSSSNKDIENVDDLQKYFPEIFGFLEIYGKKFINKFIDKKLYRKQDWLTFLGKQFNFGFSSNALGKRVCDFNNVFKNICDKNASRIGKFEDPLTQRIFALLLLLTKETITNKEFRQLIIGRGINAPIIDKINKSQSAVPTHIGNLDEYKPHDYLPNLSRCLCQMMYDLIQIAHEGTQDLFYILKFHVSMLDDLINNIKEKNIQSAFEILNIRKELLSLNFKTYIRGYGPNISMIYLAEELSFLHDIIFRQPCCSYKLSKHLGLHVVYHSVKLDDRLNMVEPFFKLPGDRRIRKIEKMCNCIIALRTKKHPTITINEYVVDIFYDFDTGNHFGAIDLLKQMMTIVNHRTLVAYPSGELWVFRDTEWLRKCYFINEKDSKLLAIFKNNEDKKDEQSTDEDTE